MTTKRPSIGTRILALIVNIAAFFMIGVILVLMSIFFSSIFSMF